MKARTGVRLAAGAVLLMGVTVGVRATLTQFRPSVHEIPTAKVRRGDLEIRVYSIGELRPTQSYNMMAPAVSGALQIMHLVKTGSKVKKGDVVLEFDTSEQEFKLEQSRSEVEEAEQQIAKAKADAAVSAAQDQVALLKARFDVRRAELDVSRNELLSAIDAQKNVLALDEAKRRLAQLEQDVHSREASNKATIALQEEKRNKSALAVKQAQEAIDNMRLKSQIDGTVLVKDNADAVGGWIPPGVVAPEYREGDAVRPGRIVAEILQVENMEIQAKINEADRANVNPGQSIQVRVDAVPGVVLGGRVKAVAGLVSREWGPDTGHRYDATFQVDRPDPRLRSGQTAQVVIMGDEVKNALFLPRQVIFDKDGKPTLYVKNGSRFEPHEIKITHRTESQVTIEGLKEGDEVALVNPDAVGSGAVRPGSTGPNVGGAR